ncbi:unnamed protein product [Durusdinium trenchii]|uniref:Uncharacterized protein n=1 Tax=Durusdinium trenchii TaxID=1381693 RepID=A0ABP0NHL0_9DINO
MAEWLSLRWMVDGLELPLPRGYRVILEESDERAERRVILAAVAIHKKAAEQRDAAWSFWQGLQESFACCSHPTTEADMVV